MKILNIHGYKGSPENSAYSALNELGYGIISPAIDYDAEAPESVLEKLCEICESKSITTIVGTSLGGFFAAVLSARYNCRVLLINPCLMPFRTLPQLGCECDFIAYMRLFGELSKINKDNVSVIVGDSDEVVDTHDFTKNLFGDNVTTVPGGKHSGATLPLKEFFTACLVGQK